MRRVVVICLVLGLFAQPALADEPLGGPAFFTTKVSETEVKIYAKDIVGVGKVSFVANDKEIAWVRAQTPEDSKLRIQNSIPYLVRTVKLLPGKNRIEILVEGMRAWRVTYSG